MIFVSVRMGDMAPEKSDRRWQGARALFPWVALLVILAASAALRVRLLSLPLERDEGEYASIAWLLREGTPPYGEIYTMKLPGTPLAYAAIMAVFGQSPEAIHLGLLLASGASILLLFFLARRFVGPWPAVVAAALFAFLALSPTFLGMQAHATHFVVLFALAGILLVFRAVDVGRRAGFFGGGLLLGVSFLMKQQGIFFLLFAVAFLTWRSLGERPRPWRRWIGDAALLMVGAAIPFAAVCAWLWQAGVFGAFWFWTFTYAREYAMRSGEVSVGLFLAKGIPLLAAAGLLVAWIIECQEEDSRGRAAAVVGFLCCSIAALLPGLCFRRHSFILLLPAAALVVAAALEAIDRRLARGGATKGLRLLAPAAVVAALFCFLFTQRGYLFSASPAEASRMTYGVNPFPEAPEVARKVAAITAPGDRVAIFGSEPEILFLAKRRSATGYVYMYEMMEEHPFAERMQREMIAEVERAKPAAVVDVRVEPSWSPRAHSPRLVFDWIPGFEQSAYDQVLRISISPDQFLIIFKRRSGS